MTEFNHVTLDATEFPNVKLNLEKSKLWVSTDADDWASCLNDLQENKSEFLDKFSNRQQIPTSDFLHSALVDFLNRAEWNLAPHFFENLLTEISAEKINGLPKTNSQWRYVSPALKELFEVLLNHGCILLPLINARADDAPKWHPRSKPSRINEQYLSVINEALETRGDKLLKGAIDTVFASICINEPNNYSEEVHASLMASDFFKTLNGNRLGNYTHLLRTIVNLSEQKFVVARDLTYFDQENLKRQLATNMNAQLKYKSDNIDNLLKVLIERDSRAKPIVEALGDHIKNLQIVALGKVVRPLISFGEWLIDIEEFEIKNLTRALFVRGSKTNVNETYFERIQQISDSAFTQSQNARYTIDFLFSYFDQLADEIGTVGTNKPLNQFMERDFAHSKSFSIRISLASLITWLGNTFLLLFPRTLDDPLPVSWNLCLSRSFTGH